MSAAAGRIAVASVPVALASGALLAAGGFLEGGLRVPVPFGAVLAAAERPGLLRLGLVLDLFGYYLPTIPLVLALRARLRPAGPELADAAAVAGLGYALLGGAGAAVLAAVTGRLPAAGAALLGDAVYLGLWNGIDAVLAGVWWLGTAVLLRRAGWPGAPLAAVVGTSSLLSFAGHLLAVPALATPGLLAFLLLAPAGVGRLGLRLLRAGPDRVSEDL